METLQATSRNGRPLQLILEQQSEDTLFYIYKQDGDLLVAGAYPIPSTSNPCTNARYFPPQTHGGPRAARYNRG